VSWLRNHIRFFVIPGIRAILRQKRTAIEDLEQKPITGLRPAKGCFSPEAGLVYAALSSMVPNGAVTRQKRPPGGNPGAPPIAGFEKDVLLDVIKRCDPDQFCTNQDYTKYDLKLEPGLKWYDVVHSIMKNSFKALAKRCDGQTIIFPGRDVWAWEVFARKNNFAAIYDPRISRDVAADADVLRKIVKEWGVTLEGSVVFDAGYEGSVWKAFCAIANGPVINVMLSTKLEDKDSTGRKRSCQVFPMHRGARAKALTHERLPKYFSRGAVKDGKPVQWLSDLDEFIRAAAYTIWLWHYQSPNFFKQWPKKAPHSRGSYQVSNAPTFNPLSANQDFFISVGNSAATWNGGITMTQTPVLGVFGSGSSGGTVVINGISQWNQQLLLNSVTPTGFLQPTTIPVLGTATGGGQLTAW